MLAPTAVAVVDRAAPGNMPHLGAVAMLAATAAGLRLARPMIDGPDARRAFAPRAMRDWLLATATSAMAFGLVVSFLALFTSFSAIASWLFMDRGAVSFGTFVSSVPGLMMVGGVIAARAGLFQATDTGAVHARSPADEAPRLRVALPSAEEADAGEERLAEDPRLRRMRA